MEYESLKIEQDIIFEEKDIQVLYCKQTVDDNQIIITYLLKTSDRHYITLGELQPELNYEHLKKIVEDYRRESYENILGDINDK